EVALQVARREPPLGPLDVARCGQRPDRLTRLWSDHVRRRVAGKQALDLLQPHVAPTDHEAPPTRQLETRDVERRIQHVRDAALVAQLEPVLADARLPSIGLSGHARMVGKIERACPTAGPRTSWCRP